MKVHKVSHYSLSTDLNKILEKQDAIVLGRKDNLMV